MIVLLDASPVGLLSHPRQSATALACQQWVDRLLVRGARVLLSEIVDYEIRRELILRQATRGLTQLDLLGEALEYLPITTVVMRRAAELWAQERRRGRPTADVAALDADVILAAQAQLLAEETLDSVVVATTNARHLGQFAAAYDCQEIEA